jgi:hypothetical protein
MSAPAWTPADNPALSEVQRLDREIDEVDLDLCYLKSQVEELQRQIEELGDRRNDLCGELGEAEDAVAERGAL